MSLHFQNLIRNNANEEARLRSELSKWTREIREEEKKLPKKGEVHYPPIRGSTRNTSLASNTPDTAKVTKSPDKDETSIRNDMQIFPEDNTAWDEFSLQEQSQELKMQGDKHFREKKWRHAVDSYTKSLEIKKDPIVFCNRAAAYYQLKEYEEADRDCGSSILLHGQYAKAYIRRALVRKARKQYVESIQDFERALVIEPQNEMVQKQLQETRELYLKSEASKPKKKLIIEESDDEEVEHESNQSTTEIINKETPSEVQDMQDKRKNIIVDYSDNDSDIEELVTSGAQAIRKQQQINVQESNYVPPKKSFERNIPTSTPTPPPTPVTPIPQEPKSQEVSTPLEKSAHATERSPSIQPVIEEIAPEVVQTNSQTSKESVRKSNVNSSLDTLPTIKSKIPDHPPAGIYEFHQINKELNDEEFAKYFKLINPTNLCKLFADDLSPEILERILRIVADNYLTSNQDGDYKFSLEVTEQLTKVNRFNMTIMFFEEEEQAIVSRLFERLESRASEFGCAEKINSLKDDYEMF